MTASDAVASSRTTRPPAVDLATHHDVETWLAWEAQLLDERRLREWLALLADDIRYRMPVTVTAARDSGVPPTGAMDHFDEDRYSLGKRVERLEGDHAWTEDPPSRARRFVSNVRVSPIDGTDVVEARSYVLLYRSRGDDRAADLVSAGRTDVLRRVEGGWILARRDIVIDEAVLRTQNLALFL
ncbi:MAG TPA: 3-phenylpropionate/cinnamic acid dioxygenase subunit beta [Ilumatobacteraceae bacterium]|nr:3-phenylpropionate/cinnamic acid dioxygenase subunit beta [Ilumatobacteraceae bacterium]